MANIGEQLLQPEEGWRRYDDSDPHIIYTGEIFSKLRNIKQINMYLLKENKEH